MRRQLTGEIPRLSLVVNSNLCLEQPAPSWHGWVSVNWLIERGMEALVINFIDWDNVLSITPSHHHRDSA